MKINFKSIASVVASTLMVGSTVALAAAASYPAPFVQNGNADVAVVYGSNAVLDLVAVTDISSSLQGQLARQTATGGSSGSSTSVSGGDFVTLAKSSDKINLGNNAATVFGTTLTDDDLNDLLADGTYTNDDNDDFDYEQRITLGSGLQLNYFSDSDYNDEEPTIGFNITSNQVLLNYSLDFTSGAQSTVTSGDLVDLETTTIDILGKEYYISDAVNSSLNFILLDTANTAVVKEGDTVSVKVGDKSYDVMISTISGSASSPEVKLSVNGQTTNSLREGSTYKLSDGTYVGIKDISIRDVAGTVGTVEFSLGSGKVELRNGQSIKINDDTVQEITSEIVRGSPNGGKETIDRINLVWTAQDDQFITSSNELVMPGFEAIKFSMANFTRSTPEVTSVDNDGSNVIQLRTTIKDGEVTLPILYASSGDFAGIGKSANERLVTSSALSSVLYNYTAGDRYLVASWNTSTEAESYLVQFTSFVNDNGINKTTVQKRSGGSWVDVCEDRRGGDTCTMGSLTLTINSVSPYNDRTVNISGNAGSSFNTLYTKEGLKINLPYAGSNTSVAPGIINFTATGNFSAGHSPDTFLLFFTEENKDDNVAAGNSFNVTLNDNSADEVEAASIATGRTTIIDPDNSDHITSYVYSDLATLVERNGASSDQRDATISYAGTEAYADLVLTTVGAIVSGGSSGSGSVTELGKVIVLDTEVSSVADKNLIVVGGSCVNSVAANLLGGALCGADFQSKTGAGSGQFLIQTFDRTGGNVATLVAGYDAGDTKNAATYLTTQTVDTTVGKKYLGTSSTTASLVTS